MNKTPSTGKDEQRSKRAPQSRTGLVLLALTILGVGIVYASNDLLTRRFSETLKTQSRLTATVYARYMVGMLERQEYVPSILALNPDFISALQTEDYSDTSKKLIEFKDEANAAAIDLIDVNGVVVASSEKPSIGLNLSTEAFFTEALRRSGNTFTITGLQEDYGIPTFQHSDRVVHDGQIIGVVVVHIDLRPLEASWRDQRRVVSVTDNQDRVILASNPRWRRSELTRIIESAPQSTTLRRILQPLQATTVNDQLIFLNGEYLLRNEITTTFDNWKLTYFASLDAVRARVNSILAFEIMLLALLVAVGFYMGNQRLQRESREIVAESDKLRRLNTRLSEEIEERRKVERDLKVAEQSLEQASKLAALGQMSAAVSHELNQPLAAMRTYLAGARLLLKRNRADEALSSFYRIDDLLERMGAITRQLKSYARKSNDAERLVDMRDAVDGSISMMSPQLKGSRIEVRKIIPPHPVMVRADPIRIDQIIVNLLRNAVDAVDEEPSPVIEILLVEAREVSVTVRDNGTGIKDPDALFEPFYTTKKPGEGIGLGLAISAGIAGELGGRLTARNAGPRGAIFELQLPRAEDQEVPKAAE